MSIQRTLFFILLFFPATHFGQSGIQIIFEGQFDVHPSNEALFNSPLASFGNQFYVTFVNSKLQTEVARKKDGEWQRTIIEKKTRDNRWHNQPSIAADGEGYLHLVYNMHSTPWQYSVTRFPEEISTWRFRGQYVGKNPGDSMPETAYKKTWLTDGTAAIPGNQITYPFMTCDSQGNIFLAYRECGRCETGNYYHRKWSGGISKYTVNNGRWQRVGNGTIWAQDEKFVPLGIFISFGPKQRMHISWVWNAHYKPENRHAGLPNWVAYARSDDGGTTFKRADGSALSLPITFEESDKCASPAGPGKGKSTFWGYTRNTGSPDGKPYVLIMPRAQRQGRKAGNSIVSYRDDTGWQEPQHLPANAAHILIDDAGNFYAVSSEIRIYRRAAAGKKWKPLIVDLKGGPKLVNIDFAHFRETGEIRLSGMTKRPGSQPILKIWTIRFPPNPKSQ